MLFVKHPTPGEVKTRLGSTVGDALATSIYRGLLDYTCREVRTVPVAKEVHYGNGVPAHDMWQQEGYPRLPQSGADLGERMKFAFQQAFERGCRKVVIIGSDCYQLDASILQQAFDALSEAPVVLGPSADGGYYLLGLTTWVPQLFEGKAWSTESVADATRQDVEELGLSYIELPMLSDIDTEADLKTVPEPVLREWGYGN